MLKWKETSSPQPSHMSIWEGQVGCFYKTTEGELVYRGYNGEDEYFLILTGHGGPNSRLRRVEEKHKLHPIFIYPDPVHGTLEF